MHMDDLSSDDENDGGGNRIGRVPLHWYDGLDHIGYDVKVRGWVVLAVFAVCSVVCGGGGQREEGRG